MLEERKKILEMLAGEQITVEDAARLMDKLDDRETESLPSPSRMPKVLRIHVCDQEDRVNVQVPLALLRTGIKIKAMMPDSTHENLKSHGVDLGQLSELDVDELISALADLRVEVDGENNEKVRIFCE